MRRITVYATHFLCCGALLVGLAGCDAAVNGVNTAASVTKQSISDARDTWGDIFTYHPKETAQLPQTRYCYQMQSDNVCYDSVQPGLTSRLIGYQDGEAISWVQPGGGSLGASGGEPVVAQAGNGHMAAPNVNLSVDVPASGQISSTSLAPIR
jgi:hypothetical protein